MTTFDFFSDEEVEDEDQDGDEDVRGRNFRKIVKRPRTMTARTSTSFSGPITGYNATRGLTLRRILKFILARWPSQPMKKRLIESVTALL